MKIDEPLTPEKAYAEAKLLLAQKGHKIFTPSFKYFKLPRGIICVRPFQRSVFFLALHKGKVIISGMHDGFHSREVLREIESRFAPFIVLKPRRLSRFRGDRWESLSIAISPKEREEFDILTKDTRLEKAG